MSARFRKMSLGLAAIAGMSMVGCDVIPLDRLSPVQLGEVDTILKEHLGSMNDNGTLDFDHVEFGKNRPALFVEYPSQANGGKYVYGPTVTRVSFKYRGYGDDQFHFIAKLEMSETGETLEVPATIDRIRYHRAGCRLNDFRLKLDYKLPASRQFNIGSVNVEPQGRCSLLDTVATPDSAACVTPGTAKALQGLAEAVSKIIQQDEIWEALHCFDPTWHFAYNPSTSAR